jgi:hypothetical protein
MGIRRFKMTIKELSFEIEGDDESVQNVQNGLKQTLNSITHLPEQVLDAPTPAERRGVETVVDVRPKAALSDGVRNGTKSPRLRRNKSDSPQALILELISGDFFMQKRNMGEIRAELARMGHNFEPNEISSPLVRLTQRKILSRERNSENEWVYEKGSVDGSRGG